jgi:hypothetical protein
VQSFSEAHQNGLAVPICVLCPFKLFLAVGAYEEGQKVAEGLYRGGGLTIVDACHMLVMGQLICQFWMVRHWFKILRGTGLVSV